MRDPKLSTKRVGFNNKEEALSVLEVGWLKRLSQKALTF